MKIFTLLSFLLPLCLALVVPKSNTDGSDYALILAPRQAGAVVEATIEATFEFVFEEAGGQGATEEAEVIITTEGNTGRNAAAAGYAPSGTSITGSKFEKFGTRFFFRKFDEFTGFEGSGNFLYDHASHKISEWGVDSAVIKRPGTTLRQIKGTRLSLTKVKTS
ncbi:uncharacterized protein MYCGRDRAFT_104754 [Zymoseptoria tritici IPO323]|uniref:Uncharacterized protein n=1 Tax=Zymoseptoria tritici (strain CBS 115943 / IPO323) TaxID=336722 RepID=F9XCT7_ZYMTI|nr:uncharacterized protein MYCGRDRAFT_104754 [Zymoseptoria tritici IPO323]EGP86368.1 hypothetical protein MYCGRDRAFT_104754 [Zymoseptoria tritici IPO323]